MHKQTIVGIGVVTAVVASVFGYAFWQWRSGISANSEGLVAIRQASEQTSKKPASEKSVPITPQNTSDSIALGGGAQKPADPNALKVGNGDGLGGGLAMNDPNGSGAIGGGDQKPAIPGPESFGQYDKYKDSDSALYIDIAAGNGRVAQQGKKAAVLYKGWLTNGSLFDQSRPNKDNTALEPFIFTLGAHQVIAGWEQGIAGMKVGGTRRLVIPPAVGYGAQGAGPIPAQSVLVFDVQLIDAE